MPNTTLYDVRMSLIKEVEDSWSRLGKHLVRLEELKKTVEGKALAEVIEEYMRLCELGHNMNGYISTLYTKVDPLGTAINKSDQFH